MKNNQSIQFGGESVNLSDRDTDEQAEFARDARRGLVNNPPSFGGG